MTQSHAPWLDTAWAEFGVTAIAGPAVSDRVRRYYADAGHAEIANDEVAWCAAFVGACLERSGIRCTRSLMARSYLAFGEPAQTALTGTIGVFSRGDDPELGHVAFIVGETVDAFIVLGGNQGNAVGVIAMPRVRLLGLRWPQESNAWVAPQMPAPLPNDDWVFQNALAHVLSMEGGFSDDPYDPGGATNLGITIADLAEWRGGPVTANNASELRDDVEKLTIGDVTPIYRARYWTQSLAPALPAALALFHFDTAVNHGVSAAAHMLQTALRVASDGEVGPDTLSAARAMTLRSALDRYAEIRRDRYRGLSTFWRFGRGWLARVDATLRAANQLISQQADQIQTEVPSMTTVPQISTSTSTTGAASAEPKWWGQSLTIWGTIVTGFATVLPIAAPLLGIEISADVVRQLGDGVVHAAQAIAGVLGILMTVYGRSRAIQPLVRRDFLVKV